jgi:hypothetical protein
MVNEVHGKDTGSTDEVVIARRDCIHQSGAMYASDVCQFRDTIKLRTSKSFCSYAP